MRKDTCFSLLDALKFFLNVYSFLVPYTDEGHKESLRTDSLSTCIKVFKVQSYMISIIFNSILVISLIISALFDGLIIFNFTPTGTNLIYFHNNPCLQVESIILSIISMLSSPNDESPANIDAAVSN